MLPHPALGHLYCLATTSSPAPRPPSCQQHAMLDNLTADHCDMSSDGQTLNKKMKNRQIQQKLISHGGAATIL